VEYLCSISGKNMRGITWEIFVGYFEEDLERILTTIFYLLISTHKQIFCNEI
jgi:hypothetical protein